jgi:hypothetical protein
MKTKTNKIRRNKTKKGGKIYLVSNTSEVREVNKVSSDNENSSIINITSFDNASPLPNYNKKFMYNCFFYCTIYNLPCVRTYDHIKNAINQFLENKLNEIKAELRRTTPPALNGVNIDSYNVKNNIKINDFKITIKSPYADKSTPSPSFEISGNVYTNIDSNLNKLGMQLDNRFSQSIRGTTQPILNDDNQKLVQNFLGDNSNRFSRR